MWKLLVISILSGILIILLSAEAEKATLPLFQIKKNSKVGFVNSHGNIVISPQFYATGNFKEELAPARRKGLYGYINRKGTFVIPERFEFAHDFHNGKAIVYIDRGKPCIIDKEGNFLFKGKCKDIYDYGNDVAIVVSHNDKYGLIDQKGHLILDTIHEIITPLKNGLFAVNKQRVKWNHEQRSFHSVMAIIDKVGKRLTKFGQYHLVSHQPENDQTIFVYDVKLPRRLSERGYTSSIVQLDKFGQLINRFPLHRWENVEKILPENRLLLKVFPKKNKYNQIDYSYWYYTIVTMDSKLIRKLFTYYQVDFYSDKIGVGCIRKKKRTKTVFSHSFIESDYKYEFISISGKKIYLKKLNRSIFESIQNTGSHFIARAKNREYIIDFFGNLIDIDNVSPSSVKVIYDDFIFYTKYNQSLKNEYQYEIYTKDKKEIIPVVITDFDKSGFVDGILRCEINNKSVLLRSDGKIIWKQKSKSNSLNIDYKRFSEYFVEHSNMRMSSPLSLLNEVKSYDVKTYLNDLPKNKGISIHWTSRQFPSKNSEFIIANNSESDISFPTIDYSLYMIIEAKDKYGVWKEIEQMRRSWCGNSYINVSLHPNQYWKFIAPVFEGSCKTKLRFKLTYHKINPDLRDSNLDMSIYSNEFDGFINPAQLWRTMSYRSTNVMDPYY